jgi:hypothetical protein
MLGICECAVSDALNRTETICDDPGNEIFLLFD